MKSVSLVLCGLWLGALVASWVVAPLNFRMVDRVLADARPEMAQRLAPVPPEAQRQVLRLLASENNRWMFGHWAWAQAALGVLLVALCWRVPGAARYALVAALVLVAAQLVIIRPIVDIGRSIDFAPRPLAAGVAHHFGLLHSAWAITDLAKAALLVAVAWMVARRG